MKEIASALLLSAAISAPAFAANGGTGYISLDYGQWSMSNAGSLPNPTVLTVSGGVHFTPNVGAEVGYAFVGNSTATDAIGSITFKQSALKIAAVGTVPLGPRFDLFGKLGLDMVNGDLSGTGAYSLTTGSATTNNVMYGIGGQFNVNSQLGVRLQYEKLGKTKGQSGAAGADVTSTSVGVAFGF